MIKLAFWAAISDDGEILVAYSADDGNNGDAARTECNQYINDALLNDRAALRLVPLYEAVAPMLASARVPEREALEAIKRLPARPFPDPIAHSWEAFGRAVMGAFTDAKFIAIRALAAAPKPETKE